MAEHVPGRETQSDTGSGRPVSSWAVLGPALVAALGGFLFGYDTGVISAALLYIAPAFHLSDSLQQVVVASLLLGAIVGVLSGGAVVDAIGRRRAPLAAAVVFTIGALLSALSPGTAVLVTARFLLGVAIGASSLVVPTYIAELSPKEEAERHFLVQPGRLAAVGEGEIDHGEAERLVSRS
jgi:MFS family permease